VLRTDRLTAGWRSDLALTRFDGEIADRGDHLVVRTPSNPAFWWGNFLLFDRAPRAGDLAPWLACFEREFPAAGHRAFGIDAPAPFPLPGEFVAAGFALAQETVLTATAAQLRAPAKAWPAGATLRALRLPEEAAALVEQWVEVDAGRHPPHDYRGFAARQVARYGAMQHAGLGAWFGLWADGALVASCGLFRADGAGRFQFVATHPAWRRRGLCTALVHAVARHGFEAMGLDELVLVADPADVAIGVYESLGFARGASRWQLERAP
jgi:RimJ/RimL family protein N-acetyltransferase